MLSLLNTKFSNSQIRDDRSYLDLCYPSDSCSTTLALSYSSCHSSCLFPFRIIFVHQRMETSIMAWFYKMTEFMHYDMLYTPIRQQQQIGRKTNAAIFHVASPPTRYHRFILDRRRADAHHLCMPFYHRFNQCSNPFCRLILLSLCFQWKLIEKSGSLLLSLCRFLSSLNNPFLMLVDKSFHLFF